METGLPGASQTRGRGQIFEGNYQSSHREVRLCEENIVGLQLWKAMRRNRIDWDPFYYSPGTLWSE
jgi:hypothetical protein